MAGMFRKKSLERLSTPDRLDQLLRIVRRRSWIPLLALGGMLIAALVWSVLGRIPLTTDATAILVHPREVRPIQPPASGELQDLRIHVGKLVKKGEVIGTLNRPDLKKQLELEKQRLAQFLERSKRLDGFNEKQAEREKKFLLAQRQKIGARIESITKRANEVREQTKAYNKTQRANLAETRRLSEKLGAALLARYESYQTLKGQGLANDDTLVSAQARHVSNLLGLAEIGVKLQELELRKIQADETYAKRMDLVADLQVQLEQLDLKEHEIEKRIQEAQIHNTTDAEDIQRTIDRLENSQRTETQIISDHTGVVLEVTVTEGTIVSAGQRIASMAAEDPSKRLVALAYFTIANGKKVRRGMSARISPVTVEKQRFGSIVAEITEVSAYPVTAESVVNQVGNREMAKMLVGQESRIEVAATLQRDDTASGFKWTSAGGPGDVPITAGTTARVRITTERRAPITLLMPALRRWLGLD